MPSKSEELDTDQPKSDAPVKKTKAKETISDKKTETAPVKVSASSKPASDSKPTADEKPETIEKAVAEKAADKDTDSTASSSKTVSSTSAGMVPPSGGWKRPTMMVAAVVLGLVAIVIVVFGILIYGYKSDNAAVKTVAAVVPYPVERVNGHFVSYSDYLFEVEANERAYQNNAKLNNQPAVDFNSATGKKLAIQIKQHSLQTLETNALVAQLASQKKVEVTDAQVNTLINQLYQRYGGQATLLKTLNQIYGWNLNDLKKVVRQQLLQQNLQNAVTSDPAASAAAKQQAEDVVSKLKGGADFATLAKQDSQASDASSGGDMGSFTKTQVPAAVWTAASVLQVGQVSDPVKVSGGYVVLKVVTKNADGSIHAQEILINTVDFNTYMAQKMKAAKVNTYLKV